MDAVSIARFRNHNTILCIFNYTVDVEMANEAYRSKKEDMSQWHILFCGIMRGEESIPRPSARSLR